MERISCIYRLAAILAALLIAAQGAAATSAVPANAATVATQAANAKVLSSLPFSDKQDFEDAQRGFIARPDKLTIRDANGKVVWDLESYKQFIGLDQPAPETVNPSLWRNAQLNLQYGLFKVTDRIYQARGYDLSNITLVQGDTGWFNIVTP
jgi:alkyl sulfatase BDS1-like metallo-beta-lactamase superfamily hydrolase